MGVYDSAASLADRMLRAKGRATTFSRGAPQIDPVTQQITGSPTTYSALMLAIPLTAGKAALIFGAGATDITKARLQVTIALKGVTQVPQTGDRFTWGGKSYALLSADPLDPDGSGAILAQGLAEAA